MHQQRRRRRSTLDPPCLPPDSTLLHHPSPPAAASIPLPGGALWWQNLHTGGLQPVYGPAAGETFVLQRRKVGGPGLVRSPRQPPPMRAAPPAPAAPPMVWLAPAGGTGLTLAGVGGLGAGSVVIDTEFEVLTQPRIQVCVERWRGAACRLAAADRSVLQKLRACACSIDWLARPRA